MKSLRAAVKLINQRGALLVFPIDNRPEPLSLWSLLYPRSEMVWKWDSDGDNRVAGLWHLREELARSREVIYTKWYQGRATFFSKEIFSALLSEFQAKPLPRNPPEPQQLLDLLEESSPLSTKQLKQASGLQGRPLEGIYSRALKELWSRALIVGVGEVDDGAFPSLSIGATRWMFEDLWNDSEGIAERRREEILSSLWRSAPRFHKFYSRLKKTYS